ncbi:hypothetical protein [Mycobacterium attenuatum]|uniref:hypothetical protein n=1 Tax=Mycobacterium attenuatum TaxID=2341086 RepID=UPI003CC7DFBC
MAGVDRKTARDYTNAAVLAGLDRGGDLDQLTDELIGAVIEAVRPGRPDGHGATWELLRANHDQIAEWVGTDLTVVKIGDLLARRGAVVPQRTLHRYCTQCTAYRGRGAADTVPVVDGEPGVECQIDFGTMGKIFDPGSGRNRVVNALIFTAVYSRHMFVWLTFNQALEAILTGCEAAWRFFGGVFKVLIPDNMTPIVPKADSTDPQFSVGWTEYSQARGFFTDPARVAHPCDKPRVERMVALLGFVWAPFLLFSVKCVVGDRARRFAGQMSNAHWSPEVSRFRGYHTNLDLKDPQRVRVTSAFTRLLRIRGAQCLRCRYTESRVLRPIQWPTKTAAKTAVGDWIERIYNRRRRHSALAMMRPVEFEDRLTQTAQAA